MGWDEVCERHRMHVQNEYISCDDPGEKGRLIELIIQEFPALSVPAVDAAIGYCCAATRGPRLRKEFLKCVSRQLGNEDVKG